MKKLRHRMLKKLPSHIKMLYQGKEVHAEPNQEVTEHRLCN
jgi:hypothetical protein